MTWSIKRFGELTTLELFKIYELRSMVFVVEQNSVYQDVDKTDLEAIHVMKWDEGVLVAYARVYKSFMLHIGRVIVRRQYRGQRLGNELLTEVLKMTDSEFPGETIRIEAQSYLVQFYSSFGFEAVSDEYILDGLPHIDMERQMIE
ncbi:GNAT family N-acetyltransferase [Aerococcaceae bacterium DSM 111176]|nr:GNAT family N-acetyltransferase [Aerococcaceae bacterium DSM 111176]